MKDIRWLSAASAQQVDDFLSNRSKKATPRMVGPRPVVYSAGVQVRFAGGLESALSYANPPEAGRCGTVVLVRTASGDTTTIGDYVFVRWEGEEEARLIKKGHLIAGSSTEKIANTMSMRLSTVGDLSDFVRHGEDLVHKATRDLWALRKEGDDFVIERLFQEDGNPLKV